MDTEIYSLKLASKLRERGIKVIVEFNKKKVKKAFNWASRNNIPYVLVIGEDEVNTGNIKIRDMVNSNDIESNINDIDNIYSIVKK